MIKLISVIAVAVMAAPVAAYAASTQQQLNDLQAQIDALQAQVDAIELTPGPQGETGPDGSEGPEGPAGAGAPGGGNAFQLTVAGDSTNGNISDSKWNDDCAALGGRAANTKDLLTLPWDLAGSIGGSWVRPYIVGGDSSWQLDITGIAGNLSTLACGTGGNKPWTASISSGGDRGLVASNGAARTAACGETNRITCVVPAP